jgi:hypothetical protein
MFIHNMFFHNSDAMFRVVRKHTFLGSHIVIVTWSLICEVTHDTPHHLNNLNVDYCRWIIEQEECPSGEGLMLQEPRLLVLLQFGILNTPRCLLTTMPSITNFAYGCFIHNANGLLHQFISNVNNCKVFSLIMNCFTTKWKIGLCRCHCRS